MNRLSISATIGVILGLILLVIAVIASKVSYGNAELIQSVTTILPQLEGPYERVSQQVNVPVLLPKEIPDIEDFWVTPGSLEDPNKYEFYIDMTEDCDGAGWCTKGSFGGELVTEATPAVEELYAHLLVPPVRPMPRSTESMGPVELSAETEGLFVPWEATAQCSEARVYWKQDKFRYFVGIKCGTMQDLIAFANSVIENQPSN